MQSLSFKVLGRKEGLAIGDKGNEKGREEEVPPPAMDIHSLPCLLKSHPVSAESESWRGISLPEGM